MSNPPKIHPIFQPIIDSLIRPQAMSKTLRQIIESDETTTDPRLCEDCQLKKCKEEHLQKEDEVAQ